MMDDFDFEDDIGDLQAEDVFLPPVNNNGSRLSNHKDKPDKFVSVRESTKGLPPAKNKPPAFPKASGKFGFDDDSDEGDDFGLEDINNKKKAPDIKPQGSMNKSPVSKFPIANNKSNKKNDDYDLDFDDEDSPKNGAKKPQNNLPKAQDPHNIFPSPGFSKDIEKKVRPERTSGIDINGMKKLNDKLDNSSDFGDYEDDLSNLNMVSDPQQKQKTPLKKKEVTPIQKKEPTLVSKQDTPPKKKESLKNSFPKPIKKMSSITKSKAEIIESKDKPITDRTGPNADPIPENKNLRLDTNQKERIRKKKPQAPSEKSDYESDIAEKDVFVPEPADDQSDEGTRFNKNTEEAPKKPKFRKQSMANSSVLGADEDLEELYSENAHLLSQISEFTEQMDQRMVLLRKVKKVDQQLDRPNSAINSKKAKLDGMFKKMKLIKNDIQNMNKIVDNSNTVNSLADNENKIREQEKILSEQKLVLKDRNKVIREQKKFIREAEKIEDADGKASQVNSTFDKSKDKLRELKKRFTEEDKMLLDRHEEFEIMRDRCRRIKDIIQEKKRIEAETGVKQAVTEEDIVRVEGNIDKLEAQKKDIDKQWRKRIQLQEDRVIRIKHESNQMELKHKEKENEYRMINLKIKELKRTIQSTYVHKATDNSRKERKKSARSVTKTSRKAAKEKEQNFRPNSSKRAGLQEAIKQEYEVEDGEFNDPPPQGINKGVDFNGGEDSFEEYENDFDRTMEHTDKKDLDTSELDIDRQTSKPIAMPGDKEHYSKVANKRMSEMLNNSQNTENQSIHHNQSVDSHISQVSKPSMGQKSKPMIGKMASKPTFALKRRN
ncbi:unnamed protein product [Moneuplotes crassus]|uniref:Uncharacterized protein n=1 Tax=Euplotes crassus TaxID=5936 RepID=A0AAD1Y6Q2_EUPCR|nr:unnamed protein product [Moneuplotes crassus]